MQFILDRSHQVEISLIGILCRRTLDDRCNHAHVLLSRETSKVYIISHWLVFDIDTTGENLLIVRFCHARFIHIDDHLVLFRLIHIPLEHKLAVLDSSTVQVAHLIDIIFLQHNGAAFHVTLHRTFQYKILGISHHCQH